MHIFLHLYNQKYILPKKIPKLCMVRHNLYKHTYAIVRTDRICEDSQVSQVVLGTVSSSVDKKTQETLKFEAEIQNQNLHALLAQNHNLNTLLLQKSQHTHNFVARITT